MFIPGVCEGVLALLTFKLLDLGLDLELEELRLDWKYTNNDINIIFK